MALKCKSYFHAILPILRFLWKWHFFWKCKLVPIYRGLYISLDRVEIFLHKIIHICFNWCLLSDIVLVQYWQYVGDFSEDTTTLKASAQNCSACIRGSLKHVFNSYVYNSNNSHNSHNSQGIREMNLPDKISLSTTSLTGMHNFQSCALV